MFSSAFGIIMTFVFAGYLGYYGYNIIKELYFDKSGEVVQEEAIEEKEVDISDDVKDFEKYNANEDAQSAALRKAAEEAAQRREGEDSQTGDPIHENNGTVYNDENNREGSSSPTSDDEKTTTEDDASKEDRQKSDIASTPGQSDSVMENIGQGNMPQGAKDAFANVQALMKGIETDDVPVMGNGIDADDLAADPDKHFSQGIYYIREMQRSA